MANDWFKFKKFTIQQDRCAMKVGTDGVILGAWTPIEDSLSALDIGTGTGLIALMLAQRYKELKIDAIEIDRDAASQARENVNNSPFSGRINVIQRDFKKVVGTITNKYDLIVCNPPYFSESMKPENQGRSLARHTTHLEPTDLFNGAAQLLNGSGVFSLIVPSEDYEDIISVADSAGLYPFRRLNIIPIPGKDSIRSCLAFRKRKIKLKMESLLIEAYGRHDYSEEYKNLTKDFYLNF